MISILGETYSFSISLLDVDLLQIEDMQIYYITLKRQYIPRFIGNAFSFIINMVILAVIKTFPNFGSSNFYAMKKYLIVIFLMPILLSCTKEQPDSTNKDSESQLTELQALRKEIEVLKAQVEALTPSDSESGISVTELEALKAANEELKAQVGLLTAGFFEVDGLRFDLNGTLISTEKIANEVVENKSTNGSLKLTTTRTHDSEGRVIEIMNKYSGYSSISSASLPYYWRQELFEYNGKTITKITRTNKYGLPAGTQYEEVISEKTYW